MPENLHLSQEMVQQIVSETQAERELSQSENALRTALKRLKLALPNSTQTSLRNYLIHLGEEYAKGGKHPNFEPHTVSGLLPTGEEVTAEDHFRSDEKLDQIVGGVTQLLDWIDHTPASMKSPSNWWDRIPHWLDEKSVAEILDYRFRSVDVHKLRSTERLIGWDLPHIYRLNFGQPFRVSRTVSGKYGPGVQFVSMT